MIENSPDEADSEIQVLVPLLYDRAKFFRGAAESDHVHLLLSVPPSSVSAAAAHRRS
jgi:hypothetical protein